MPRGTAARHATPLTAGGGTSRSRACASPGRRRGPPAPPRSCRRGGWRRARAAGCPASPSSAALKLAFSSRSANGDSSSISRHQRTVSSSSSLERDDRVHEPHRRAPPAASYWRHRNQISFAFFWPTWRGEQRRAEAAVEAADARPGLPEARVVGGDREVADHVQHVAAADRVAGDHRDDRLGQAPHLHLQVGHVEAADRRAARRRSRSRRAPAGRRRSRRRAGPRRSARSRRPSVSSRARSSASDSSISVSGRNALRTSGRSIVIFAMPVARARSGCPRSRRRPASSPPRDGSDAGPAARSRRWSFVQNDNCAWFAGYARRRKWYVPPVLICAERAPGRRSRRRRRAARRASPCARKPGGFLTAPSDARPVTIALDYVRAHPRTFELDGNDVDGLRLTRAYRSGGGDVHLQWEQLYRGIPVFGPGLRANVAADGQLINVGEGALPDPRVGSIEPRLSALDALLAAARAANAAVAPGHRARRRATSARRPSRAATGPR